LGTAMRIGDAGSPVRVGAPFRSPTPATMGIDRVGRGNGAASDMATGTRSPVPGVRYQESGTRVSAGSAVDPR